MNNYAMNNLNQDERVLQRFKIFSSISIYRSNN
jgi:hypothetical protein